MKISLIIWLLFFTGFVHAQQAISDDVFEFGEIYTNSKRYIDLTIGNSKTTKIYILRVEHSPEVTYRLSSDLISPDSSVNLRIQVNPKKKGDFNFVFKMHLSDQSEAPVVYQLNGSLEDELPTNDYLTQCPDFNAVPVKSAQPSELTIRTIDKETKEVISKSTISIIHNGQPSGTWVTGNLGLFKEKLPPGFFYFLVSKEGYLTKEAGIYVGPEISEITIPLSKDPKYDQPVPVEIEIPELDIAQKLPELDAEKKLNEQMNNEQVDSITEKIIPELAAIPSDNFDESYFKDVNVIFVIDISSSMKNGEKMNLMKYSLNQLVSKLRPNDDMGMVTYANTADVFQAPTSGSNKESLKSSITSLKPSGMTAGGKGIKLGYKEVMKNYDPAKANMVIIITDGAFNKDSDDYQKTVQKYAKKGVVFSVLGIETRERDAKLLQEAAAFGNGRYVSIQKLVDAHSNLTEEIRIAAFKGIKK
ncbi:vWA domain-containing protein [Fluviicola taffensis]|uniref:von Willebrand factor type A n=1 Tax=Fluviicola taffensis (strain DSM 16823 / NCIMB 13979 / RW262) TaxID=755732 RepID=F2ICN3_FLUTR|nr:VWA domain-containing protein [Fluviicola taffensis]AEA42260.1 von Willebrand factor type A [Fluviicola taffensis DSM 16823]